MRTVGKTKNAGYQMGARKTFPVAAQKAWDILFSNKGLTIWLGEIDAAEFVVGNTFSAAQSTCKPTTIRQGSHVRLQWQKDGWENKSILQLRIIPSSEKTTISFHQEKLLDADQRREMLEHWQGVLNELSNVFA